MTKDELLILMHEKGKSDALDLRARSNKMDGTQIIDEEEKIPKFDSTKDYTQYPIGAPVWEMVEGARQVFTLLQPHHAASYPGSTPSNTRSLWALAHTKNADKAKPWIAPVGTSGLYAKDECCTQSGKVWRSLVENNAYSPEQYAPNWQEVTQGG